MTGLWFVMGFGVGAAAAVGTVVGCTLLWKKFRGCAAAKDVPEPVSREPTPQMPPPTYHEVQDSGQTLALKV